MFRRAKVMSTSPSHCHRTLHPHTHIYPPRYEPSRTNKKTFAEIAEDLTVTKPYDKLCEKGLLENPTFTRLTWNDGCGWNRVTLWGQEWNAREVSYFISFFEFLIGFFLLAVATLYRILVEKKQVEHDERYATPHDYTVLVRGLPKDVKVEHIREHFSRLYDLDQNHAKHYPYYGMNVLGASLIKSFLAFILLTLLFGGGAAGFLSGPSADDDDVADDDVTAGEDQGTRGGRTTPPNPPTPTSRREPAHGLDRAGSERFPLNALRLDPIQGQERLQ